MVLLAILHVSVDHSVLCSYATIYTMFPVFSLVLDQDVKPEMALLYPELYKDLTKVVKAHHPSVPTLNIKSDHVKVLMDDVFLFQGRSLSFKTFLIWVLISVYQGMLHATQVFCKE